MWPKPTIDVLNLQREESVRVDTSVPWETIVWKIAFWLTPVSSRTWEEARHLFKVVETWTETQILRPVNPVTGQYFDSKPQVRDNRASYTYW